MAPRPRPSRGGRDAQTPRPGRPGRDGETGQDRQPRACGEEADRRGLAEERLQPVRQRHDISAQAVARSKGRVVSGS